jgi:preprotein translocase subunit SecA
MLSSQNEKVISTLFKIELVTTNKNQIEKKDARKVKTSFLAKKIPRNSLCPCGSGKKYKHCHGN